MGNFQIAHFIMGSGKISIATVRGSDKIIQLFPSIPISAAGRSSPVRIVFLSLLILFGVIFAAAPLNAADTFTYQNPLPFSYTDGQPRAEKEVRDPCIIREGDTYYLIFTMAPFANREDRRMTLPDNGSSPGIALYSSPDLKTWKFENWLVKSSDLPVDSPYKNRFWAPEIHKFNGKFYIIFTADNWIKPEYNPAGRWGTAGWAFVGVADRITGPYQHISYIKGAGCDTTLFQDTDGKTYAIIPRYDIYMQEIDLTGLEQDKVELLGEPKKIVSAKNDDIGAPVSPRYMEGPWLQKIGDVYTLIYAEPYSNDAPADWKGYWVGAAYARSVMGPYQKDPRGKIFLGGHAAIFTGPDGGKWISYRCEVPGSPAAGRVSIEPFRLNASGKVEPITPSTEPQSVPLTSTGLSPQ